MRTKKISYSFLLIHLILGITTNVYAQTLPIGDPVTQYLRLMSSRGQLESNVSWQIQPIEYDWLQMDTTVFLNNPWASKLDPLLSPKEASSDLRLQFYTPILFQSVNSRLPAGMNDGAKWQGKGYNMTFSNGIYFRYKFLEASLRPEFGYTQNADYAISPIPSRFGLNSKRSTYAQRFNNLDMPYRFGDEGYSWSDWGNSYIKVNAGPIAVGVSNEHHWIGSATQNPIMMSNNGPGFQHAYLQSSRPIQTLIGSFESMLYWGALEESDYYDSKPRTGKRFAYGLSFNYSPSYLPGIHLGFNRTYYEQWPIDGLSFGDIRKLVEPFYKEKLATEDNPSGDDKTDQFLSIMLRWVSPNAGIEVYGEFARNDHAGDKRDFILEIEHATAYTLGALKTFDLNSNRMLTFNFETTKLGCPKTGQYRACPYIYSHHIDGARQGFTQKGQILGAAIGSGANSSYLEGKIYDTWGSFGLFLRRTAIQNQVIYQYFNRLNNYNGGSFNSEQLQNNEYQIGILGTLFRKKYEIDFQAFRAKEINRYFVYGNDHANYHFGVTFRYLLDGFLR